MESSNYDTLLHLSSETETVLRSINNFLLYFLMWTGGSNRVLSFISMNQLCTRTVRDSGIAKLPLNNIHPTSTPDDFTNYRDHYLQGYWEVKDGADYSAVSLKVAYPITPTTKLQGVNGNWCYVTKFKRHTDSIEFYFIQMTQSFGSLLWHKTYRGISELVQYIKKNFPGEYIIVGNFNVQGHEKIFEHFLGEDNYHICPFYKTATCNNDDGISSPDGLVVSKELYMRVEYAVDFYSGYNCEHFIIKARLYPFHPLPGTYDTTDDGFKDFLKLLKTKYGVRDFYINNAGIFKASDSKMVGSPSNIKTVDINKKGPETLLATKIY